MASKIYVALPAFMVKKYNSNIEDGKIPDVVCSQYQLISGLFMVVSKMIEQGESFLTPNAVLTANDIYDYADTYNVFFSEKSNQVCSGSKVKIVELIEIVLYGDVHKEIHDYGLLSP